MRRAAGGAAVLLTALLLGGCAATPAARPATTAIASPSAPAGDRELARFAAVAEAVVRARHDPGGLDFVRALEAAGYHRSALQATADRTSVGLAVPAVQFAARTAAGACLIGQYGTGGLQVVRAAPVDGACLIGDTRPLG